MLAGLESGGTSFINLTARNECDSLKLESATVLSVERLCIATYRLQGDGLELLLAFCTIEPLREYGRMLGRNAADLPSLAALLRS